MSSRDPACGLCCRFALRALVAASSEVMPRLYAAGFSTLPVLACGAMNRVAALPAVCAAMCCVAASTGFTPNAYFAVASRGRALGPG